ncbi:MAG: hypothetical protein ACYC27_13500 [Armatimonadota bacterium]
MIESIIILIYALLMILSIIAGELLGKKIYKCFKQKCTIVPSIPGWMNLSIIVLIPGLVFTFSLLMVMVHYETNKMEGLADSVPILILGTLFITAIIIKLFDIPKRKN